MQTRMQMAVRPTAGYVYDRAPMLIYWEMTQACDLACRHCRAEAIAFRRPDELTTDEGRAMLRAALGFGEPLPHFVFTGGDPLKRPDLIELIEDATGLGFGVSLAPAATPLLTPASLRRIRQAGIESISLSLDGSTPERHDGLRGIPGTFDVTMRAARDAREAGLALQINTLVTDATLDDLPAMYERLRDLDIMRWSLFFLISVGRGRELNEITPAQSERLMNWLYDLSRTSAYAIKTTEATHYRRVAAARMRAAGMDDAAIARTPVGRGFGIRDGNGIMFVSYAGHVYPSGFLPMPVGSVRTESIVNLYRHAPLFARLRDVGQLTGKCGECEYKVTCGGSRARAYAWTGDPLASDPLCVYEP